MSAPLAPFPEPPRDVEGELVGRLRLPAAARFGRGFNALRARVGDESFKPPAGHTGWLAEPTAPAPDPADDGTRRVRLGEGREAPTPNQLRLASWLAEHEAAVCERVSRLFADWYAEHRRHWVEPQPPTFPAGLPFLPPAGDPAASDRLVRVGDVHLAPEACRIGLVLPVALFEGQPFGVCVTDFADYELGDDGIAYVSNDD